MLALLFQLLYVNGLPTNTKHEIASHLPTGAAFNYTVLLIPLLMAILFSNQ